MAPDRRYASIVAIFATALFVALVIFASGLISLLANREVLTERDAEPLIAPVMFALAAAALYVQLVTVRAGGSIILTSVLIGVIVYLVFTVSGATLYSLGSGQLLAGILFFASNALGPYALAVGGIAIVVAFCYLLLLSFRESGGARRTPRWPWQDRDDRERRERE